MKAQVLLFQKLFSFLLIFFFVFLGTLALVKVVLEPKIFEYAAREKGAFVLERMEKAIYDICGPLSKEYVVEKVEMPSQIAGKGYVVIVNNNHATLKVGPITIERNFSLRKQVNGIFHSSQYLYIYCNGSNVEIK